MDLNNFFAAQKPFILGFARENTREIFLKGYSPLTGFSIGARGDKFVIFCSGHRFNAEYFKRNQEKAGFRIFGDAQIMSQNDTIKSLSEDKRIFGLDPKYIIHQQNWDVINTVNPYNFNAVLSFLGTEQNAADSADDAREEALAQRKRAAMLYDVQDRLIEQEREFFKTNLFTLGFTEVLPVSQGAEDGVVFAFKVGLLSDKQVGLLKENAPLKVGLKSGAVGFVTFLRYSSAEGLVYCSTSIALEDILTPGTLTESENVAYRYITSAIASLKAKTAHNTFLETLLLDGGFEELSDNGPYQNPSLNPSQLEAVKKALNTEDFLLVQGPPGTGKTKIIVEMVKEFIKQGKRVLICSQSNHAVDNVLVKCLGLHFDAPDNPPVHCLRIGNKVEPELLGCRLLPLTETIQQDMTKRSAEAFKDYEAGIAQRAQTINEFSGIAKDIAYLIACFAWVHNSLLFAEKSFGNDFLEMFFTPEKIKKIRNHVNVINTHTLTLINGLVGMINSSDRPQFDPYQHFSSHFEGLKREIGEVMALLDQAGGFLKLYLKGDAKNQFLGVKNYLDKNSNDFASRIFYLRNFGGNLAADALPEVPYAAPKKNYGFDYSGYQQQLGLTADSLLKISADMRRNLSSWQHILLRDNESLSSALLKSIKIVGATCIGSQTKEFGDLSYDVAIVDEAGQIPLHNLLVPLVKIKKVILVGDHIQLPPLENTDLTDHLRKTVVPQIKGFYPETEENRLFAPFGDLRKVYSVSLFEILYNRKNQENFSSHCVMLDTQYRCHPEIADFVSEHFYEGTYKTGLSAEDRSIDIAGFNSPIYFIDTASYQKNERFEKYRNSSVINTLEARICAEKCVEIITAIHSDPQKYHYLMDKFGNFDVGVISGYSAQVNLISSEIRRLLTEYFQKDMELEDAKREAQFMMERIAVDSLDSFQGMEKEIIIFSATRSNEPGMIGMNGEPLARYTVGFLDDTRRLNVLMTRAKRLLINVGDSSTLTSSTQRAKHNRRSVGKLFAKLIETSVKIDAKEDKTL